MLTPLNKVILINYLLIALYVRSFNLPQLEKSALLHDRLMQQLLQP